jgi:dihydroorotase
MQLFINNVLIIHNESPYNGQKVDMIIENGVFQKIGKRLKRPDAATVIEAEGAFACLGFMDIGVQACDPGFEHREDVFSIGKAAAFGGFTSVAVQPNTQPALHSKSEIAYIKNKTQAQLVDFQVIGAMTHDCKGEEISEMCDMHHAGAIAFSDGKKSIKESGILLRALQYVKAFDGLIINHPFEKSVAQGGQMHEGVMSTSLGMKGISSLSEEMMLVRDLYLLEYCESRLHVANISTARSVDLIRQAKAKGLQVTASVAAVNLAFEDNDLADFDTFLKVQPPLRAQNDIAALREGLADGTIDFIASNHIPHDEEAKNLEFPYADFGAIGLETAAAVANTFSHLTAVQLVEKLSTNPRKVLKIKQQNIAEGEMANLTIFNPDVVWTFEKQAIRSKCYNSPFIGRELKGKTVAVINQGKFEVF